MANNFHFITTGLLTVLRSSNDHHRGLREKVRKSHNFSANENRILRRVLSPHIHALGPVLPFLCTRDKCYTQRDLGSKAGLTTEGKLPRFRRQPSPRPPAAPPVTSCGAELRGRCLARAPRPGEHCDAPTRLRMAGRGSQKSSLCFRRRLLRVGGTRRLVKVRRPISSRDGPQAAAFPPP